MIIVRTDVNVYLYVLAWENLHLEKNRMAFQVPIHTKKIGVNWPSIISNVRDIHVHFQIVVRIRCHVLLILLELSLQIQFFISSFYWLSYPTFFTTEIVQSLVKVIKHLISFWKIKYLVFFWFYSYVTFSIKIYEVNTILLFCFCFL